MRLTGEGHFVLKEFLDEVKREQRLAEEQHSLPRPNRLVENGEKDLKLGRALHQPGDVLGHELVGPIVADLVLLGRRGGERVEAGAVVHESRKLGPRVVKLGWRLR